MALVNQVTLVEVGPRDGLQNEKQPISTAAKLELIHLLQAAGLREIEVTSFVNPKRVPQTADNTEVMASVQRKPGVRYSVLVPNMQGFEAALACRPDQIVVFSAASETFNQRNINCSIDGSIARIQPVVAAAHTNGIKVRAAISCALGCPYQGDVSLDALERVVRLMKGIGADHCSVADTIGVGTPHHVQAAMERALKHFPLVEVSGHFHDTYGQALANIYACLEMGIHTFDASVAGLGGCPFAQGATGNVATEDVVFMLRGLGINTGVELGPLMGAVRYISGVLQRKPASRAGNALLASRARASA